MKSIRPLAAWIAVLALALFNSQLAILQAQGIAFANQGLLNDSGSPANGVYDFRQNTNAVGSVNWSNVVTSPSDNGTTKTVIVDPAARSAYYRLKQ